jgi:predicted dehydrogenase
MNKLNFAIIGCGRISYKHIEGILKNNHDCKLVAVCDVDLNKATDKKNEYCSKSLENHEVNVYVDYKEMLANEDIHIVTIATESGYHPEIAINCMNEGKHVIVEKPMALSIEDADKMIAKAKEMNVKLCVCHQNRFNKPIQKLRKAIEEERFGKLINGTARILWNRNENYYIQAPWRGTWELDGGTLMNQCIHDIDLLQWMMGGEIETVFSMSDTYMRNIEAEDFGAIMVKFKNGSIGIIEGSACVYPKNLEETLSIFGEKGTVVIGGLAVNRIENWRFADNLDSEEEVTSDLDADPDSVYGDGHSPLFKDMIDAIKDNRSPLVSGEEGKKAMSIILAAYKSRVTGMPVQFPFNEFSTEEMKKAIAIGISL